MKRFFDPGVKRHSVSCEWGSGLQTAHNLARAKVLQGKDYCGLKHTTAEWEIKQLNTQVCIGSQSAGAASELSQICRNILSILNGSIDELIL